MKKLKITPRSKQAEPDQTQAVQQADMVPTAQAQVDSAPAVQPVADIPAQDIQQTPADAAPVQATIDVQPVPSPAPAPSFSAPADTYIPDAMKAGPAVSTATVQGIPAVVQSPPREIASGVSQIEDISGRNLDEALSMAKELLAKNPGSEALSFQISRIWYLKEKYIMAWKPLDEMAVANPANIDIYNAKGKIFERMGKEEIALRAYDRALELDSDSGATWYRKGKLLAKLGKDDEARRCLEQASSLGVGGIQEWYEPLANPQAKPLPAVSTAAPAAGATPEPAPAADSGPSIPDLISKMQEEEKAERLDAASSIANEILAKDPENIKARIVIIKANAASPEEKLNQLGGVLSKDPGSLEGMKLKADLLIKVNRADEGVAILEDIVDKYPRDAECWKLLIETQIAKGRLDDAEDNYRKANRFIRDKMGTIKNPRDA
jgi:tetratricopeptide (TPR) repeat protein